MFSEKQRQGHDKRHKCSSCGKVRYEKFMKPCINANGFHLKTRFNNKIWFCNSNACLRDMAEFWVY